MKNILLALVLILLSSSIVAEIVSFDVSTQIVTIPFLKINGQVTHQNIKLLLNEEESLEIINMEPYTGLGEFTAYLNISPDNFTSKVFTTNETNEYFKITGITLNANYNGGPYNFVPINNNIFPDPLHGKKGSHVCVVKDSGDIIYAAPILKIGGTNSTDEDESEQNEIPTQISFEIASKIYTSYYDEKLLTDVATGNYIQLKGYTSGGSYIYGQENKSVENNIITYTYTFNLSTEDLPDPDTGTKGDYYYIDKNGSLLYADFL